MKPSTTILLAACLTAPAAAPPVTNDGAGVAAPVLRVEGISPVLSYSAPGAHEEAGDPVLFYAPFDSAPTVGRRAYFEYGSGRGFAWDGGNGAGLGEKSGAMWAHWEKGQVNVGDLKVLVGRSPFAPRGIRPTATFRELYWRVYVRHEPGWTGNPAKLARATCMAGPDWSQGMIAHVWGGRGDVLCIDPATGIRDSRKVSTRYNDFANLRWLGSVPATTPLFSPTESGRWVCVEAHMRLNTPGKRDGVFTLTIDGRQEASRTDLDWHGAWEGDGYGINAVFLESYWNQGAVKPESRWFDEFVVGTRPIGPAATTTAPVLRRTATSISAWEAQAATDPDGKNVVWASRLLDASATEVRIDAAHGRFIGSHTSRRELAPDGTYWLRVRERTGGAAGWSAWSVWHAPFRTAAPLTASGDGTRRD